MDENNKDDDFLDIELDSELLMEEFDDFEVEFFIEPDLSQSLAKNHSDIYMTLEEYLETNSQYYDVSYQAAIDSFPELWQPEKHLDDDVPTKVPKLVVPRSGQLYGELLVRSLFKKLKSTKKEIN